MRRLLVTVLVLSNALLSFSQSYSPKDTLTLTNMSEPKYEWVDADNDGRLDIFVTGRDLSVVDSSRSVSTFMHQQPDGSFNVVAVDLETFGTQMLRIADMNKDGLPDLIVSASGNNKFEHFVFQNNGTFTFTKDLIDVGVSQWTEIRTADLNNDGDLEILATDDNGVIIYQETGAGWEELPRTAGIAGIQTDPVILDFDRDGFLDIFLSGINLLNDSVAVMLINKKDLEFEELKLEADSLGILDYVVTDFNGDAYPDLFAARAGAEEDRVIDILLNDLGEAVEDSVDMASLALQNGVVFAADLTSDGLLDTDKEGLSFGNTPVITRERIIQTPMDISYNRDTLINSVGEGRRYGDFDFDGDLDYIEGSVNGMDIRLVLFENVEAITNAGPNGLGGLLVFNFQGDAYIAWGSAFDDFTVRESITYDAALSTVEDESNLLSAGFNPETLMRNVVGPGNQGLNSFMIYENAPTDGFFIDVMAIDNAFHYDVGSCISTTEKVGTPCGDIDIEEVVLCGVNTTRLETNNGEEARWFSQLEGYIGEGPDVTVTVQGQDFIIALYSRPGECVQGEVFSVIVEEPLAPFQDVIVCEGTPVVVGPVLGNWASFSWTSANQGEVSVSRVLNYVPEADEQVTLEVTTLTGCTFQQSFLVSLDRFEGAVQDSVLQITEGESVQLVASGGTSYVWEPVEGLNVPIFANPIATPEFTTTYTVNIFNARGCRDRKEVRVEVLQTAFAPEMFSPNGDGRNEAFLIYDMANTAEFMFTIFDRNGNKVFESSNEALVTRQGWDGLRNGELMPVGTYYWRIEGTYVDGQEIKINGETKGALQLVR